MPYDEGTKKMCINDRYIAIVSFQIETTHKSTSRNSQLLWTLELFATDITANQPYREYNNTTLVRKQQLNADIVFMDCTIDRLFVIIYSKRIHTYSFDVEQFL
jgi:hypothetical protein